jgi:hypothetical protein
MEVQSDPYEKQDNDLLVHESEDFAISNDSYVDNLLRVDVTNCESLKKENDDRAFLLYNILTREECMDILFFWFV